MEKEVPRVRLLPGVGEPLRVVHPKPKRSHRRLALGMMAVCAIGLLAWLGCWIDRPLPIEDDSVVVLGNGLEIPAAAYIAANSITDPKVTDLRSKDGNNGMWYKELKAGRVTRLWRSDHDKYIHVQFDNGVEGKCTVMQKLTTGTPYAKFTHVKQYDSGWARQDFIAFELTVPKDCLSKARHIQRGGTGELVF